MWGDIDTPIWIKLLALVGTVAVLVWMVLWAIAEISPAL